MTNSNFIDWLRNELETRGWSQAELARQSKLSPAQITRLLNGERGVGENGLNAIARALRLPPETVFRAAGKLPNRATDPRIDELSHKFSTLDESRKNVVSKLLDVLMDEQEKEQAAKQKIR